MKVFETSLPSVLLIAPRVFRDDRGVFFETYRLDRFRELGIAEAFVQDNHSRSKRGVLRGLHYQEPHGQGKLVRCVRGAIFDVAVDIRVGSPSFSKWHGVELNDENNFMLWVPAGFAHGFCTLSDVADVTYKCTDLYDAPSEYSLLWNDPDLEIDWPIEKPILSGKDAAAPRLKDAAVLPKFP